MDLATVSILLWTQQFYKIFCILIMAPLCILMCTTKQQTLWGVQLSALEQCEGTGMEALDATIHVTLQRKFVIETKQLLGYNCTPHMYNGQLKCTVSKLYHKPFLRYFQVKKQNGGG